MGQQDFGAAVLAGLHEQGEEMVGALTGTGRKGEPDPVARKAQELEVPVLEAESFKAAEVRDWVSRCQPDLIVLAFVTQIIPPELFRLARQGAINFHPSLLPRRRGASAMHWSILQGDKETGITVHYIDEGIDTGDIVLQEAVPIDPDDSVKTLYFQKLYPLGVKLLCQAVAGLREGRLEPRPQDESQATYEPPIAEEHLRLDWTRDSQELYRRVRAGDPFPGAPTWLRGEKLKVWAARPVEELPAPGGAPGEVLAVDPQGFLVQAGAGGLQVLRVQAPDTGKIPASELARDRELKPGEVLGE